jgi:hypothetical protein
LGVDPLGEIAAQEPDVTTDPQMRDTVLTCGVIDP